MQKANMASPQALNALITTKLNVLAVSITNGSTNNYPIRKKRSFLSLGPHDIRPYIITNSIIILVRIKPNVGTRYL
ncbi:hypothetical protein CXF80_17820 [Shewanella sp. Actino-trap-3]|nr:hypothetical protein CXF80_17820 [Shewanella sp. Actino-trap-3]